MREDIRDGRCLMTEVLPAFLNKVDDAKLRERCEEAARACATRHPDMLPFALPVR